MPIIGIEKRILDYPKVAISNRITLETVFSNVTITDSNICMIKGSEKSHSSNLRTKYFEMLAKQYNCTYDIFEITDDIESLANISENDFSKYKTVFCWTDIVAHRVYSEIIKQGLTIPQETQLIGFDGLSLNNIFGYKLKRID